MVWEWRPVLLPGRDRFGSAWLETRLFSVVFMSKNFQITIGDVGVSIEGNVLTSDWEVPSPYRAFVGCGRVDISLRVHQGSPTVKGKKAFACPPIWTLYRQNGTSTIQILEGLPGFESTLVLPSALEKADLYFPETLDHCCDPFYGSTLELLMLNYLAKRRGAIIHSCGIERNGCGMLFVGESGAGKSTIARMWDNENGIHVLSDDRTIVRKKKDEFWIYGTPWHGEAKFGSPRSARLKNIFFLSHGEKNWIKEMRGADPVLRFLTASFPPYWDADGMAFSLELFSDLAHCVPCHELSFRPEKSAIDFVKKVIA